MLRVDIDGPSRLGYLVRVTCEHGATRLPWRRTCPNGCHRGSRLRRASCAKVSPSDDVLGAVAIMRHGMSVKCGCDRLYWMVEGPRHERVDQPHVYVYERPLGAADRASLAASGAAGWGPAHELAGGDFGC